MSSAHVSDHLINLLNKNAIPLTNAAASKALLKKIGDCRFVLIGEATHGTREFYETRAQITRELIEKKGFMAVAIEGNWPDAYSIHRFIQGKTDKPIQEVLKSFSRFPSWMWCNKTMPPFLKWLRNFNETLPAQKKIGFYGLDLYSLNTSIQAVIDYLMKIDPAAANYARERYSCFDHFETDEKNYGLLTSIGIKKSCIKEAMEQLIELQHHALEYVKKDDLSSEDEYFYALQNARLVKNAENYYRVMFEERAPSWNIRDTHMAETINVISDRLEKFHKAPGKIVIWAHNSHVGDARATEMATQGEINIGQLIKEQHGDEAYLIGFSTYEGFVTASSDWDSPAENKRINPGLDGSYEALFHHVKYPNFLINLTSNQELDHFLHFSRLQRAIGVIYRPETERLSHYFFTRLPYQFDSLIHFDQTHAVEPL